MKKRLLPVILSIALILPMISVQSFAVDLPKGWWPLWSAFTSARDAGNIDATLKAGDAIIAFYADVPRNVDSAEQLYNVYYHRLSTLIYEQRGEYDKAIRDTKALMEVSQWLTDHGVNRGDVVTHCKAHLDVITPMSGVYAVSYTQDNSYGSDIAAGSGTYYGTNHEGAFVQNDQASVASVYFNLESESARKFDYVFRYLENLDCVIQANMNFLYEGDAARSVPHGAYDSNLKDTLKFLNTVEAPVLLRIGGEMNVWSKAVTPAEFIGAYNYIGAMARKLAPNVELVWSPNFVGSWGSNPADYYPDDSYVDWVGLSLYYNYDSSSTKINWLEFSHGGRFSDPIANAECVIEIARAKNKPVAVTEGGASKTDGDGEAGAAAKTAKEFSTLTMVYPEVKSIIHFDMEMRNNDYTLNGSLLSAVKQSIKSNPTLISNGENEAGTYIPLRAFNETVKNGVLTIGATGRTYNSMDMSATYTLDGQVAAKTYGSPNLFQLDLDDLSYGTHTLSVTLEDGKGYRVTEEYAMRYDKNGVVNMSGTSAEEPVAQPDPVPQPQTPAGSVPSGWAQAFVDLGEEVGMIPASVKKDYQAFITREQFAEMLIQALELGKKDLPMGEAFSDCSADYVRKARGIGMVSGTGDNTFNPNATITRQEMVIMLLKARDYMAGVGGYQVPAASFETKESDPIYTGVAGWALSFMKTGYETNIIAGDGKTLDPLGKATCEQSIIMVWKTAKAYFDAMGI